MNRKIYVASSWRNEFQQDMVKLLRDNGHDVYDADNRYGPRFYFLHRDNIQKQITAIQATRGVACPSHVTQWQLRSVFNHTENALLPYKGRLLDFRNG